MIFSLSIVAKLKELGWEKDLAGIRAPDELGEHKLVNKPQRLTPRSQSAHSFTEQIIHAPFPSLENYRETHGSIHGRDARQAPRS